MWLLFLKWIVNIVIVGCKGKKNWFRWLYIFFDKIVFLDIIFFVRCDGIEVCCGWFIEMFSVFNINVLKWYFFGFFVVIKVFEYIVL